MPIVALFWLFLEPMRHSIPAEIPDFWKCILWHFFWLIYSLLDTFCDICPTQGILTKLLFSSFDVQTKIKNRYYSKMENWIMSCINYRMRYNFFVHLHRLFGYVVVIAEKEKCCNKRCQTWLLRNHCHEKKRIKNPLFVPCGRFSN